MSDRIEVDTREVQRAIADLNKLSETIPRSALRRAGLRIGKELKEALLKPTATWNRKPAIKQKIRTSGSGVIVMLTISDEAYVYVALGTKPHRITPKRAKMLVFPSGYKAKTSPGSLSSSAGGKFGDMVYSLGVSHPGVEAREFHIQALEIVKKSGLQIIAQELRKEIRTIMGAS